MALTIEDGSGVANANSYATVIATKAFATARGFALATATDAVVELNLTLAKDYLEGLRAEYQGTKTAKANALQFPRVGVEVDGFAVDADEIPDCLVQAQMRLACYAYDNGSKLTVQGDGRVIVEKRIEGVIDTKWADHGDSSPQPSFPEADALLAPLLQSAVFGGAGIAIRV